MMIPQLKVILITQLSRHEARRNKVYDDATGKPVAALPSGGIPTIGVGRNLAHRGLSENEIDYLLGNDIEQAEKDAKQALGSAYETLSLPRRAAICNMAFNLGLTRLLEFKKLLTAIRMEDFRKAAWEMRNSKWAKQVGDRAEELATIMEEDKL